MMTEVDNFLQKHVEDNNTPSVQYILFDTEKVIHEFRSGFADIDRKKNVSENTAYHAFSVTKTFTALAVMQLAENKMLQIEDPVKKYFPDFPYATEITIQQLLTHSAGIPNPIPLSWIHLNEEHETFDRNQFFNKLFARHKRVTFKPNEKFAYSNLGYVLLGRLIERVSGMLYEEYISVNILSKLGLQSNKLGFVINSSSEYAKGYHKRFSLSDLVLTFLIDKTKFMDKGNGKWKSFKDYYVNGTSYGGLFGTPDSFVKYVQELLKPGSKLISDNYKELIFRENHTTDNKATGMCLSWFKGQLMGETYFAHAGGGGGYYCEIRIYPCIGTGSVIMFNRTGITDEKFLDKTDKYYINRRKG